jgi:hypothetical protein
MTEEWRQAEIEHAKQKRRSRFRRAAAQITGVRAAGTLPTCKHCSELIRRCFCVAHGPPFFVHHPSGYHRCGEKGAGPTLAELGTP